MTSNPSIFQQALAEGERYDAPLKPLLARGCAIPGSSFSPCPLRTSPPRPTCCGRYRTTTAATASSASRSAPTWPSTVAATVAEATRLFASLGRKNVMIKVPATLPGLTAIEGLTAAGVNVNVTLLFSVPRYREVMEAYLAGLEARHAAGKPAREIASVASFFVSRVDSLIDGLLDRLENTPGKRRRALRPCAAGRR